MNQEFLILWKRRLLRCLHYGLIVFSIMLALAAIAFGIAQTKFAKQQLAAYGSHFASQASGYEIRLIGLSGVLPFEIYIEEASIEDEEGVWLRVNRFSMLPNLLALLRGAIVVEEIQAESIVCERIPAPVEPIEDDSPSEIPPLDFFEDLPAATIKRIAAGRIELASPVLGDAQAYSLEGGLISSSDGGMEASMRLASLSNPGSGLMLEATLKGRPAVLRLTGEVNDPDGDLGRLAGLEDSGGLSLLLNGEGALTDWRGELRARADTYGTVDSRIRLTFGEDIGLGVDGKASIAPAILDATAAQLVGDSISFDARLTWPQTNRVVIERFEASVDAAQIGIQGEYSIDRGEIDGRAALSVADIGALQAYFDAPFTGAADIVLNASGEIARPRIKASIRASDFRFDSLAAERILADIRFSPSQELGFDVILPAGAYQITGFVEPIVYSATPSMRVERIDLFADFDTVESGLLQIERLALETPEASMRSWGVASVMEASASMRFEGAVANLAEWPARISADIGEIPDPLRVMGETRFNGGLIVDASANYATTSISTEVDVAPGLDAPYAQMVGETIRLDSELVWDGVDVRFSSTQVNVERAQLIAQGVYGAQSERIEIDWQANLRDISPIQSLIERPIRGALLAEGSVSGALDSIVVEARIHSNNLSINEVDLDEFRVQFRASESSGAIAGDIEGLLAREDLRLDFSAGYRLDEERVRLSQLKASGAGLDIEGDADFEFLTGLLAGEFRGASSDLARLGELVNEPLRGEFDFNARFDPSTGTQHADIAFRAANIDSQFVQARLAQGEASLRDLYGDASVRLHLQLSEARYDEYAIDSLKVEASGDQGDFDWSANTAGQIGKPFSLAAAGAISLHDTQRFRLTDLQGEYAAIPMRLTAPTYLEISEDRIDLEEFALQLGEGEARGLGWMTDDAVEFDLRARNLPAAWMEHWGAANASGVFEADCDIRGTPTNPSLRASLRGEGLRYQDPRLTDLPEADLLVEAEYRARNLSISLRAFEKMGQPLNAQAQLPLDLALRPFYFEIPQDEPIQGRVNGEFDLAILPTLFYLESQNLSGIVRTNIDIGGRLAQPTFTSGIELNDARYDHLDFGVVLRDINLELRAETLDRLVIETLNMTDGGSGSIRGEGFFAFEPEITFQIALTLDNAALIRMDEGTATLSGPIAASGTPSGVTLSGDLTAAPIEVRIPRTLPQDFQSIAFTEIGTLPETNDDTASGAEIPFGDQVQLDILVRIPNRMFVRGRGLDTEWQGTLNLRGTLSDPLITGTISIVRGTFQFFNNPLRFESGTVQFAGASPPNPFLNIIAGTTKRNTDIQLRIAGPVMSPNLGLSSNPAMSSDEILSYLLFGRHLTEITPLQAIQLANAANTLRGGGGAFDFMGQTRELLGVDQIQFRMGEGGGFDDARIGIGKYLTDEIYVDFEQGYSNKSSGMNIEVRITPSIFLESQLGLDRGSGVGVLWKRDF